MKAIFIDTAGQVKPVTPANGTDFKLKELYALIGCDMIEVIQMPEDCIMIIDEEGKLKNDFVVNKKATAMYQACHPEMTKEEFEAHYKKLWGEDVNIIDMNEGMDEETKNSIVGNCVVCPSSMLK